MAAKQPIPPGLVALETQVLSAVAMGIACAREQQDWSKLVKYEALLQNVIDDMRKLVAQAEGE